MSQLWFTADEHYGHRNIIDFCHRPFKDVDEMREELISNHNKVVKPGDRIIHLGDMFWRALTNSEALSIRHRLNGEHYYIYGNHDEVFHRSQAVREAFVWCRDVHNLKINNYPSIWLSHYAHRVWNGSHKGAYHLYGHTHNELPADGSLSFDVGVDAQGYSPISFEEVHSRMQHKKALFQGKEWKCECSNSFRAVDSNPKICSKCGKSMKLV